METNMVMRFIRPFFCSLYWEKEKIGFKNPWDPLADIHWQHFISFLLIKKKKEEAIPHFPEAWVLPPAYPRFQRSPKSRFRLEQAFGYY